jgi:hypothetical protein
MKRIGIGLLLAAAAVGAQAQGNGDAVRYAQPPAPIPQILDTPPPPTPSISPKRDNIALLGRANLPPIAELAEPSLNLAGYRINPRNNGPANSRIAWLNALSFQSVAAARRAPSPCPATRASPSLPGRRTAPSSPSSPTRPPGSNSGSPTPPRRAPASSPGNRQRRLWQRVRMAAGQLGPARPHIARPPRRRARHDGRSRRPDRAGKCRPHGACPHLPGPVAQQRRRGLFDHYFNTQLAMVPASGGASRNVGTPGLYWGASASPDGRYLLLTRAKRPFSYVVPTALFPTEITVTDLNGRVLRRIADLPLRDDIPPQFDATAPGPRNVQWRADKPATLAWVEAQDGGDAKRDVPVRDRVLTLDAPFTGTPAKLVDMKDRFAASSGPRRLCAVVSQWWNTRRRPASPSIRPARRRPRSCCATFRTVRDPGNR